MASPRAGVVSVILVNFRGAEQTIEAVSGLNALDWPGERLEIVVVDNASGDESVEAIRAAFPSIRVVPSAENLGFAGGCNLGVVHSTGEFVAFLNSDAKPESGWISAAVATFEESTDIAAVASRVLDWEGKTVDYIDVRAARCLRRTRWLR
jgi:GT2 family glycosyltransferase